MCPMWTQPPFLPVEARDESDWEIPVERWGVGHWEENPEAVYHYHSTVNKATSRPLWGWKHCASWEARMTVHVWEETSCFPLDGTQGRKKGSVCVFVCVHVFICVYLCVMPTVTEVLCEGQHKLIWKDRDACSQSSVNERVELTEMCTNTNNCSGSAYSSRCFPLIIIYKLNLLLAS